MPRPDNIDTNDTVTTQPVGNTKKDLRARYWFFTWNNYVENDIKYLQEAFKSCKKYIFQEEIAPNTLTQHLQGCCEYENARTFTSMKKINSNIHWEVSKSDKVNDYCCKDESRKPNTKPYHKGWDLRFTTFIENFHKWECDLLTILAEKPDDRKIYWIVDEEGGKGKTTFCKYICQKNKDAIYLCGKASDMKYGICSWLEKNDLRILLLDYSRSLENYVSYEGIETIKNGIFYNTKYESKMVTYPIPHVIVFSNFEPEDGKFSKDRLVRIKI